MQGIALQSTKMTISHGRVKNEKNFRGGEVVNASASFSYVGSGPVLNYFKSRQDEWKQPTNIAGSIPAL